MAAVLTGTPVEVVWASGANPAGQSITIPADATAVYMFWAFDGLDANGHGLASATLNSAAPSQTFELPTAAGYNPATGVAAWYNPSTGSQTLDVAWDASPTEGPVTIVVFVKGGDTTAWRDADADQATSTTAVTVTLTTVSGDLVIKFDQHYDGSAPIDPPGLSAGWTNGATGGNVSEGCRLSYISASGTTQVCASENEEYSSIVAISIPADAGPSITAGLGQLTLTGYAPSSSATGGGISISSDLGQLTLTGFAPTCNFSVEAGLAQLAFTGLSPSLTRTENVFITAGLGQLTATGYEPSQTLTFPSPPAGALVLTGYAPGVQVSAPGQITAGLGQLTLTGQAPSLDHQFSLSAGSLTMTGMAPSMNLGVGPGLGQLTFSGLAPTFSYTENQFAAPDAGALSFAGFAPTLAEAGSFSITPELGQLTVSGYAPDVQSGRRSSGAGSNKKRRRKYTVEIDGEEFAVSSPEEAETILKQAREIVVEKAAEAIQRAQKAIKRPTRKVLADVRKSVPKPQIKTDAPVDKSILEDIESIYQKALETVERMRDEEEAEELILMLL